MDLLLDDQERLIQETARGFFAAESTPATVRAAEEDPRKYSPELWRKVGELGWLGVSLPESCGGQALPLTYAGLLLEEAGRHAAPAPLHSTMAAALALARHDSERFSGLLAQVASAQVILTFAVQGADGAWSRVRPLLSEVTPAYTGVVFIELQIDEADTRHPELAALVPRGKISVVGRSQGLIAQRSSNGHVRAYFMFRVPEERLARGLVDVSSPARARAELRALLPGWAPALLRFIDACSDTIQVRPIVALPVGHRWAHRPGVTLLGDAAHVMPPFSGEGVNMAMLDALELALRLAEQKDWSEAVAGYEERMFTRAAAAAADAVQGLDFVSDDALAHVLEHFRAIA